MKGLSEYKRMTGKKGIALWRKALHGMMSKILGSCYRFLCIVHLVKPKVIVMMDGGICSQMNQYLIGQIYSERGEDVGYDLSWYKKNGMDVDRRFARTFELEEMFPNIRLKSFGKFKTWFYRMFLTYTSPEQRPPKVDKGKISPVYLGGYYSKIDDDIFRVQFERLFRDVKKADVSDQLFVSKANQHRCAIHVRRGDLARGDNPWYGGVSDDYFFRAIAYVEKQHPKTKFFFFSDEMNYVEENIVPGLKEDFQLIKGPHKAYEDLLLISSCDTIIASQGNFGKYAALLNGDSLLVLQDDEYAKPWLNRKKNAVTV